MNRTRLRTTAMSTAAALALPLSLGAMAPHAFAAPTPSTSASAGTSVSPSTSASPSPSTSPSTSTSPSASASPSPSTSASPGAAVPFGPGCSSLLRQGVGGSFERMATQPVATALAENTHLSTFVALAKKAGLVDKLNSTEDITVFAPTNAAFAKLSKAQLDSLRTNEAQLRKALNYHVTEKRVAPDQLPDGSFKTLEGSTLTTSGSGQSFKVNRTTNIVCGDVRTENATVYVVDSVLMPPS
ncbi:fasciclin domain-containing protein [Streptomyces sp. NPDC002018]|uniref:fasciclin domain-containing protein n=1 Tax=Streptomyces sp. NPDC002018 TaxID=3364629 RepID=UPI0036D017EB